MVERRFGGGRDGDDVTGGGVLERWFGEPRGAFRGRPMGRARGAAVAGGGGVGDAGVDDGACVRVWDAWTNMLQPFWALPLLGIMGLRARDIVGYTAMVFLLVGVVVPVALLLLG